MRRRIEHDYRELKHGLGARLDNARKPAAKLRADRRAELDELGM
ncbi:MULTISPECIES: hypothetical protein [unclassified Streptomyces]